MATASTSEQIFHAADMDEPNGLEDPAPIP